MQIVVLGAHRSGTSMVTRLLNLMGASVGPAEYIIGADDRNPKGYWERLDVSGINETLLRAAGASWDRADSFDSGNVPAEELRIFGERAEAIVKNLNAATPWVMKDPRLCMLLPLWRPLLSTPVGVVIYRNPVDVAASLHARDGFPMSFGIGVWETYTRSALAATSDLPRVLVSYDAMVSAPDATARKLFDDLVRLGISGLHWPGRETLLRFIDARLRHHHEPDHDVAGALNERQRELYESLKTGLAARQPSRL